MRYLRPLLLMLLTATLADADGARDERIRQDLAAVVYAIQTTHPNPYTKTSQADFEAARQQLYNAIPAYSDLKAYLEIQRLMAMVGDAHTSTLLSDTRLVPFGTQFSPIKVSLFDDGLFITSATKPYAAQLGLRVVSINGLSQTGLMEAARPYISYDNEQWLRQQFLSLARSPQLLAAIGVGTTPNQIEYLLEDLSGNRQTVLIDGGTELPGAASITDPAIGYLSPIYYNSNLAYWYKYYPEQKLLFFKYNQCAQRPDLPFASFAMDLFQTIDTQPVDHMVVDLRDNTGGDTEVWRPFLAGMRQRYDALRTNPRFGFYGLDSRLTASSAMFAAQEIKLFDGALLLGEGTGGNPDAYGQAVTSYMPNSGIQVNVASRYYSAFAPGIHGPTVEPDIRVYRDSSDVFVRFDPILFRVFSLKDSPEPSTAECRDCAVRSAASLRAGSVQSPNSLSTILGDFGASADIKVMSGGAPATVLYASPTQINFQQPAGPPQSGTVEVRRGSEVIWSGQQLSLPAAPAIFVADRADIHQQGTILNQDNTANSHANRAARGSIVEVLATGYTELDDSLLNTRVSPRVTIGQWNAEVLFSGPHPQYPGVWQVKVRVPSNPAIVNLMPVAIHAGGRVSNAVSLWVE